MSGPLLKVPVKVSGVLSLPVDDLWDLIKDFGRAEVWSGFYKGAKVVTALLVSFCYGPIEAI